LYAILFPVIAGTCFINLFLHEKEDATFPERIALGYCMGLMLITLEMFYVLSRLDIKFSVLTISLPLIPVILAGIFVTVKNKLIDLRLPRVSNLSKLEIFLLIMILFQVFFVFSSQMIKPVSGWDAWSGYSMRAKAYFMEGTVNVPSLPPTVRGQHNALTQTWVFACMGQWNEILGKINFPIYYICLLMIFYYAARRYRPRLTALLSAFILSTLPFLLYHATIEYCDFMLSVYLFAAFMLLFLWFNKPQLRYLLLLFVFLFSLITIKEEGILHLTIVFAVFAATIFSKKLEMAYGINMIRKIAVGCVVLGGAFMFRKIFLVPHESLAFSSSLNFSRIPALFSAFGDYMFIRDNWNIIWPLLIILLVFTFNKLKESFNVSLLAIVALELSGFMAYYFTQAEGIYAMLFFVTPAVRNMLQFMPVAVFLMANLLTLEMPGLPAIEAPIRTGKNRPH
jgi:hypothetical protein